MSRSSKKKTRAPTERELADQELHLSQIFENNVDFRRRVITMVSSIDEHEFARIDAALTELESQSNEPITIKLDCDGGNVYDALAIVGRLRESPCEIITKGYGCIMSAATLIFACGHIRKMSKYAYFMVHEASYDVTGKHSEIKAKVIQSTEEEKRWAEAMAGFSKQPVKYWMEQGSPHDTWFTAEKLKVLGVVDEIF